MKIVLGIVLAMFLAGCSSTMVAAPQGFILPPRQQVIPDPEPKPRVPANASVDVIALEYGAAYGRANQRLVDGATNYENLIATLAASRNK